VNEERRAYQRLTLMEPLDGWFSDYAVRLVDVSATGAQIEHDHLIPADARGLLRFWWRGAEVEILAQTARIIAGKRIGLQFLEENPLLNDQIAASASELLRAREANANTSGPRTSSATRPSPPPRGSTPDVTFAGHSPRRDGTARSRPTHASPPTASPSPRASPTKRWPCCAAPTSPATRSPAGSQGCWPS